MKRQFFSYMVSAEKLVVMILLYTILLLMIVNMVGWKAFVKVVEVQLTCDQGCIKAVYVENANFQFRFQENEAVYVGDTLRLEAGCSWHDGCSIKGVVDNSAR